MHLCSTEFFQENVRETFIGSRTVSYMCECNSITIDLSLYQIFIYASRRRSTLIWHSVSPCVALIKFSRHTVKSCANQAPVHIIKKKYNASEQGIYTNMHAQLCI